MLDKQFPFFCKEKIEKSIETELAEQMRRLVLVSSEKNLSLDPFKESTTVAEAIEMVEAGRVFTDAWCTFVRRVCARDSMAMGQVYVVAQCATELVMKLSETEPYLAKWSDDLARLKRCRPIIQSVDPPDYGPKVHRDCIAKVVRFLVHFVGCVGDQYRRHAECPELMAAPPKYYRWTRRAAKLGPLSGANIKEWGWCIWRAFQDLGLLEVMTNNGDGDQPSAIRKKIMRKLQALAAASQKSS